MPKAYSYVRFSTLEQRKGGSESRQVQLSLDYVRAHPGLELDESLRFTDPGVSAFNKSNLAKGAGLRLFLDAVTQGVVTPGSYLLVESLDRISRAQVLDAFQLFIQILEQDITIVTLADGMVYSKDKANRNFTDLMMSLAVMSRAHEESLTKSKRVSAAWARKRANIHQKKLTKTCPSWMHLNESKTAYLPIQKKVSIVKRAVSLLLSGVGKDAIAKRFNEEGLPSISDKKKGQTWHGSYVTKILRNRALIGEFQPRKIVDGKASPDGDPIRDYFPRTLSDEEFALVQHVIDQRGLKSGGRRGQAFPNLFTGLVKCGYCGSTMIYVNKGDDKRTKRVLAHNKFLVCSRAKRGAGCHFLTWTYSEIENGILNYAKGLDFERFVRAADHSSVPTLTLANEIALVNAKLKETISRRDRLVDSLEVAQSANAAAPTVVLERISKHDADAAALEIRLRELELQANAARGYTKLSNESANAVVQLVHELELTTGGGLYLLRARLNEHMRHLLSEIQIFAGGKIYSPDDVEALRAELTATGRYSPEEISRDLNVIAPTIPVKESRCLLLIHRSKKMQMLRPQARYPDILDLLDEGPNALKEWALQQRAKPN